MDSKFYKGRILLHLIDHATKLSVSNFVKSKKPEVILKSWIQIFDAPEKYLTDNSREFATLKFIDMTESLNITVKVTAAESSFSNGINWRHNFIIAGMMDKALEESKHLDMDITLVWCLDAKNALANLHGFSPFQLVFGQNPKPGFIQHDTSKILTDNLAALYKARQEFILSESSEKIRRASNNNAKTREDTKYITRDSVYFKKINEKQSRGPGRALGQDG